MAQNKSYAKRPIAMMRPNPTSAVKGWRRIAAHAASRARADELLEAGAIEGAKTWRCIAKLIEEWQAIEPSGAKH